VVDRAIAAIDKEWSVPCERVADGTSLDVSGRLVGENPPDVYFVLV
jgi:hypothetical protein